MAPSMNSNPHCRSQREQSNTSNTSSSCGTNTGGDTTSGDGASSFAAQPQTPPEVRRLNERRYAHELAEISPLDLSEAQVGMLCDAEVREARTRVANGAYGRLYTQAEQIVLGHLENAMGVMANADFGNVVYRAQLQHEAAVIQARQRRARDVRSAYRGESPERS